MQLDFGKLRLPQPLMRGVSFYRSLAIKRQYPKFAYIINESCFNVFGK